MKYRVTVYVTDVRGWQAYLVEAANKQQAAEIVNSGGGEFEQEELEVQDFAPATVADVEEDV
jgi:hypothetical protein